MATIAAASLNLTTPRVMAKGADSPKAQTIKSPWLSHPWKRHTQLGSARMQVRPVRAAPENITEKVAESIKEAQETCADDPASGECVAAWDGVEELSAAASHARDKKKGSDPLEEFCKDNMEKDECRTYEDWRLKIEDWKLKVG